MVHTMRYVINPDVTGVKNGMPYKGVVTCILEDTKDEAREKIARSLDKSNVFWDRTAYWDLAKKYTIKDRYVGVAYCGADDEWNEERGKEIARTRALTKLRNDTGRVLNRFMNDLDTAYVLMDTEVERLYNLTSKRHDFSVED